jgi:SRSO17 transposase
MKRRELDRLEAELTQYVDGFTGLLRRSEQRRAFVWYVTGLLLDGERKSIEPIAGRLVDNLAERDAMRQRLQQIVSVAAWDEQVVFEGLARKLDCELPGVEALVVDDTGFPKKGTYSVGVARQYSGTLGRTDNCQIAVSLHLAGEHGSGCIGMRLFLPEAWSTDRARCKQAGVPEDVAHEPKWRTALAQIDRALAWGVRKHVVLADAGYGDATEFRDELEDRGLRYAVGITSSHTVYPPGCVPEVPKTGGKGRPPGRQRAEQSPVAISALAKTLSYRTVRWRTGSRDVQSSRFAAVRVYSAERRTKGRAVYTPVWLLCEWPSEKEQPTKFYVSNLLAGASLKGLVRLVKLRWRVERDYQELKQEIGLDHFEGRTWRGFHHHAALCAVAHAFLALQRALFPPEETSLDAA